AAVPENVVGGDVVEEKVRQRKYLQAALASERKVGSRCGQHDFLVFATVEIFGANAFQHGNGFANPRAQLGEAAILIFLEFGRLARDACDKQHGMQTGHLNLLAEVEHVVGQPGFEQIFRIGSRFVHVGLRLGEDAQEIVQQTGEIKYR